MIQSDSQNPPPRKKERRRSPRLRINPLVYANLAPDNGGILLDFSDGGISISLANPLAATSQVRFSLTLGKHRPVEGAGRIAWISESGRRVGMQFLGFPDESRERFRNWLSIESAKAEVSNEPRSPARPFSTPVVSATPVEGLESQPAAAASPAAETIAAPPETAIPDTATVSSVQERRTPSSSTLFSGPAPRPDASPREEPPPEQTDPETAVRPVIPETPLFFLPKAREPEDDASWGPNEPPTHLSEEVAQTASNEADPRSLAFRTAVVSASSSTKEDAKDKRPLRKILLGTVACSMLLALAIAIHSYPGTFPQFPWLPSAIESQLAAQPAVKTRSRPVPRRSHRHGAFVRAERRSPRIGQVKIYYSPSPDEAGVAPVITETVPMGSPAPVVNQSPLSNQTPPDFSPGMSALPSGNTTHLSSQPATSAPLVGLSAVPQEPREALRNDGALVEEGSPISAPLDLGTHTSVSKPIVVEAVIGKDGGVRDVQLISSPATRLALAVMQAVKQWRYRPFYRNGEPIEFTTRITFDFSAAAGKP